MAIKKNELYSSLWASCDKLRGGMDASQYKDYILTLLFVKYVTDKFKGVKYAGITVPEGGSFDDLVALKGNKNIGEEMDKVIAKLAEAGNNNLRGVIDNAHFNDETKLGTGKEMVDNTVYNDEEFSEYADRINAAFDAWKNQVDAGLRSIDEDVDVKQYIVELSERLISACEGLELVDKYDVYEVLLSYWQEVMGDDVYLVSIDGYEAARQTENIMGFYTSGKKKGQERVIGWEGVLLPKALIEKVFFAAERRAIDEAQAIVEETQNRLDELTEEQTGDDGYLKDFLNDKDKVDPSIAF